jgi:hypothetical protein
LEKGYHISQSNQANVETGCPYSSLELVFTAKHYYQKAGSMPIYETKPECGPLERAYNEAIAANQIAKDAWIADESAVVEDETAPSYIAMMSAEESVEATRQAYHASDEPRGYTFRDDGGQFQFWASNDEWALEHAEELLQSGDYGEVTSTFWPSAYVDCEDGSSYSVRVTINPDAPECSEVEHDWQSPIELVGGIKENPGVWGHQGGVIVHEVCMNCGCGKTTDTWAQDRNSGEQGLTSVEYESGKFQLPDLPDPVEC